MARIPSVILSRPSRVSRIRPTAAPKAAAPKPAPAPAPAPAPEAAPEAEQLTMANTKSELTAAAEAAGIEVDSSDTKAEILAALYPDS